MIERRADIFTAELLCLLRRADEPQWRNSCRRLQPRSVWVFLGGEKRRSKILLRSHAIFLLTWYIFRLSINEQSTAIQ